MNERGLILIWIGCFHSCSTQLLTIPLPSSSVLKKNYNKHILLFLCLEIAVCTFMVADIVWKTERGSNRVERDIQGIDSDHELFSFDLLLFICTFYSCLLHSFQTISSGGDEIFQLLSSWFGSGVGGWVIELAETWGLFYVYPFVLIYGRWILSLLGLVQTNEKNHSSHIIVIVVVFVWWLVVGSLGCW